MRALVILSPHAGKGDPAAAHDAIRRGFADAHVDIEVRETSKGEDPGEIVRVRRDDGFDVVVAAGGDGTVSSVFDGLYGSSIPLGIVPTGTGNLVAREFGIPTNVDDAIALIAGARRAMKIDAMRIGTRVYVLNAGVGINAAIVAGTSRTSKLRWGRIAYLVTALKTFRFRPRSLDITVDGQTQKCRAVEVSISNCGILAKAMYPSGPDIRADDGHVDIWILTMTTFLDYVRYLLGILVGRRSKAQFLTARKRVTIASRVPLTAQADGDVIGTTPLDAEVLPGALTVLVPQ